MLLVHVDRDGHVPGDTPVRVNRDGHAADALGVFGIEATCTSWWPESNKTAGDNPAAPRLPNDRDLAGRSARTAAGSSRRRSDRRGGGPPRAICRPTGAGSARKTRLGSARNSSP
jgi:hypothetical protein